MDRFDPPSSDYKDAAGRGALYMALAQGLRIFCQILSVIILARLLTPSDFGVYAMAWPVLGLVGLFQAMGLSQAIIQKPKLKENEVSALFWINLLVSLCLTVFLMALAPLAGWFYKEPSVVPLILALSGVFLVQGLGMQPEALLNRKLDFAALGAVSASNAVITLAVSIAACFISPSYWALFWGSLAGCLWSNGCYWLRARWWPSRPSVNKDVFDMVKFGAGITGSNFAGFIERNIDDILIGRNWGSAALGLYDRAYRLLLFPLQQVMAPIGKVMIPILSRLNEEPQRYRRAYFGAMNQILLLILPGAVFLLVMADPFIPFILGESWRGAVPIFQALAFIGLLQPFSNPNGWLFVSQGRGRDFVVSAFFSACFTTAAILIGLPHGVVGVAIAYAISQYFKHPVMWWLVCRKGPIHFMDLLSLSGFYLSISVVTALSVYWVKTNITLSDVWSLLCMGFLSYVVFTGLISLFPRGRETLRDSFGLIQSYFKKTPE